MGKIKGLCVKLHGCPAPSKELLLKSMNNDLFKIRQISMAEAWELPWVSWNLARKNYSQALVASFVLVLITLFTYIPFIGIAVTAFLSTFLACGILKVCRSWERDQQPDFSQFFIGFNDQILFKRIFPLACFNIAIALLAFYLNEFIQTVFQGQLFILTIFSILIMGVQSAFTSFSTAIMTFKDGVNLQQAITMSINIYLKNIIPLSFAGVLLGLIALFSIVFLVLPLFFFFMPLAIPYSYFVYRATCEDLILNSDKLSEEVRTS